MSDSLSSGRRTAILIGLAIAIVFPVFGLVRYAEHIDDIDPMLGREGYWWGLVLLVLLYVRVVERRPFSSIGFKRTTWKTIAWGVGGGIAVLVFAGLIAQFAIPALHLQRNTEALAALAALPLWYKILIVIRAAVGEEILFRGFGIERLIELTGSKFIAGAVTLVLFTVGHLSHWGWSQLIIAGAAGFVLTLLYLFRRDLGSNIIAHGFTDAVSVLFTTAA